MIKQKNFWPRFFGAIKTISKEQIYNLFDYGIPIRSSTIVELRKKNFTEIDRPVFFLSTGRCGTTWFAKLLAADKKLKVFHEPTPKLSEQAKFAYLCYKNPELADNKYINTALSEIFLTARENQIRFCFKTGRRLVETNHYITFFAQAIAKILPTAIFIHIYRHPGEIVRSGIRRGWYTEKISNTASPISPVTFDAKINEWKDYNHIQKIAWLWNETNQFIENFKQNIDKKRIFSFNFNQLEYGKIKDIINFIGTDIKDSKIKKMLFQRANIQKKGRFAEYNQWEEKQKADLKNIVGDLASKYGYQL